jgi:signal transduction histidine kinase
MLAIGCLVWTFRNTEKIAITEFRLFLVVVVLWISTQIVELVGGHATSYYASFLIRGLRGLMAFSWFNFTMTYAGYGSFVHSTRVRVIVGVATSYLVLATAVSPIATEFIFPTVTTTTEPLVTVSLSGMTPFRRTTQFIGYSLVLIGTTGLTYRFLTTGYTKWWRPAAVLAATLLAVSVDLIGEIGGAFLPGVDYAAIGATAASVLLIGVLYRHDLFASAPVGRDHLFRTLNKPVFVVDSNQRIMDCNEAARRLCTGTTQIGSRIDEVLPGATTAEGLLPSATDEQSMIKIDSGDATRMYELTRSEIAPVGDFQESVVILNDITEQRQRKQELERQNQRLEEFASVVSHDLRSPLSVAGGRLELAMQECNSEHLDTVANAHERMETLIDDLLRLAKQGATVEETQTVQLADVSEQCWAIVETGDAILHIETDQLIEADPSRLQELLENLIRNAVEHVGTDVTITIGELPDGFYIADDGPGIPLDKHDDVFEIGYSTSESGTGLGLHIVQEIVHAHGWEIAVRTGESDGTRFEITGIEIPD